MIRLALLLLCLALPARGAEQVVLGLSQNEVAITATFDGSEILIFGAVKREEPIPADSQLQIVVTVAGPSMPVTVRKQDRVLGIWANRHAVEVDQAPSFYAVASTAPLPEAINEVEDLRYKISVPRAIRAVGTGTASADDYIDALIRIREEENLYQVLEGDVDLEEDTLFRASVDLPANLTEGNYTTRIFLTRQGRVIDSYETTIGVQKVGLERFLYNLAHEQPFIYGIVSLVIAVAAGWGANAAFRALRN